GGSGGGGGGGLILFGETGVRGAGVRHDAVFLLHRGTFTVNRTLSPGMVAMACSSRVPRSIRPTTEPVAWVTGRSATPIAPSSGANRRRKSASSISSSRHEPRISSPFRTEDPSKRYSYETPSVSPNRSSMGGAATIAGRTQ